MTVVHKRPQSYVVNGMLAIAVFYWVLDLSAGDRGWVDWVVIALVVCAVSFNIWQLSRRLSILGRRAVWHVQRTVLFWVVGLMNTVFRDPRGPHSWTFVIGVLLVVAAMADTVALYLKERRILQSGSPPNPPWRPQP